MKKGIKKKKVRKNKKSFKKIIKSILSWLKKHYKIIILILIILVCLCFVFYFIDRKRVLEDDKKPLFAIKTVDYSDGASKEYMGLGYKVIMYQQIGGRYDNKIGSWRLKFVDKPTEINLLDFAIEYTDNPEKAYKKYEGEYISLTETPYFVDVKNNVIRFQYNDPDGKYTTSLDFYLMFQPIETYKDTKDAITVVGTVDNFRNKSEKTSKGIIIKNAFVKDNTI